MSETIDEYNQRNETALKNAGAIMVSKRKLNVIIFSLWFFIVISIALGGYFLFLMQAGALTPKVQVNPMFNPQVNVTALTTNNNLYDFKPETTNTNDYNIQVVMDMSQLHCIGYENATG